MRRDTVASNATGKRATQPASRVRAGAVCAHDARSLGKSALLVRIIHHMMALPAAAAIAANGHREAFRARIADSRAARALIAAGRARLSTSGGKPLLTGSAWAAVVVAPRAAIAKGDGPSQGSEWPAALEDPTRTRRVADHPLATFRPAPAAMEGAHRAGLKEGSWARIRCAVSGASGYEQCRPCTA